MEVKRLSDREYSLDEIQQFLKKKDKEYCFRVLSALLNQLYHDNYQGYINIAQMVPSIVNSFLLFSNGSEKNFEELEMNLLIVMLSSLDSESSEVTGKKSVYSSYIKVLRNVEYPMFVLGRVSYIFNWIEEEKPELSFERVSGVSLESIFLIFWGAFAVNDNGNKLTAIDLNNFFSLMKISDIEKEKLISALDQDFSISLESATAKLKEHLNLKSKKFEASYNVFEEMPFLKIQNLYLLIAPHLAINNLMYLCIKFYITKYSNSPNNLASSIAGQAFEEYCRELVKIRFKNFISEPVYKNRPNDKGPDVVIAQKNKIPVIFEFHKATIYKSLVHDYRDHVFSDFLSAKVVKKFQQIFNWLKSHDYHFQNVDFLKEFHRIQFIVVIAEPLPLSSFDETHALLLNLINEKWVDISGQSELLIKDKNIYVLGAIELETLIGSCDFKNTHVPLKLFDFKKYIKLIPDIKIMGTQIQIRSSFEPWVMDGVKYQDINLTPNKKSVEKIFKQMEKKFKK